MVRRAGTLGDGEYVVELRRLLGWFGEGHTTVLPFEFLGAAPEPLAAGVWGFVFPLKAVPFHDGMWVAEAAGDALRLLGGRILSVNGRPIERVMSDHAAAWPSENPAWAHTWGQQLLHYAGALHGLDVIRGGPEAPVTIDAIFPDGRVESAVVRPARGVAPERQRVARSLTDPERFALDAKGGNFTRALPNERALYVSIDDVSDVEGATFSQLTESILAGMKSKDVERIVVDLRRNGGGDNYLSEPLRHEIARSRFNRSGGLYVLIGPKTFSAAQNLANRLERETLAVFVGEPTGSAPNIVGDPELLVGDATGVTVMVAKARWFDGGPDDHRRWIFPDIFTPSIAADWVEGKDRALSAALADTAGGGFEFSGYARYFERDSQRADWRPFWRNEWGRKN